MLDCERWTLTHSSGWAAVLVGLGLALVAMKASSEAETVADAEVWDDDGEAEPGWDGEPVPEGDPVPEGEVDAEPEAGVEDDGEGVTGVLLGAVLGLGLGLDAGALGEAEVEEADGEGVGDFEVGVGVGVGEGVLAAGSTSHLVSVLAPALVEVPGLAEAAPSFIVPARATPGQPASTPRVRKTPVSRLSTIARTCARRIKIALSTLLIGVTVCSSWYSEATR